MDYRNLLGMVGEIAPGCPLSEAIRGVRLKALIWSDPHMTDHYQSESFSMPQDSIGPKEGVALLLDPMEPGRPVGSTFRLDQWVQ